LLDARRMMRAGGVVRVVAGPIAEVFAHPQNLINTGTDGKNPKGIILPPILSRISNGAIFRRLAI
jgi:hypothetical protein